MLLALSLAAFFGIIQGLNTLTNNRSKKDIPTTTNLWDYLVDNKYHS